MTTSAPPGLSKTTKIVLVDLTTDATPAALRPTTAFLHALAEAMDEQVHGPFAQEYGRQYVSFAVKSVEDRQAGDLAIHFRDTLDVEGALAYHTVVNGVPDMEVGVDYCSSLGDEGESVSSAADHEVLEMLLDPGCNLWADTGKGYMRSKEAADTVQNTGYKSSNGLWMSNFLRASAWIPGAPGPWDYLGLMKEQDDYSNGYEVHASPPKTESQVQGRLGESIGHTLGTIYLVGALTDAQLRHKKNRHSRTYRRGGRL